MNRLDCAAKPARRVSPTARRLVAFGIVGIVPGALTAQPKPTAGGGEWVAYGHDAFGSRFSPLAQITRENVAKLAVAWTYRTGDADATTRHTVKFEATPLMVDGTLYLSTPFGRVIALDPERGVARWTFDAHVDRNGNWGDGARATPMTYQLTTNGRQFVVVAVGGGDEWGKGDYVVAFALPN